MNRIGSVSEDNWSGQEREVMSLGPSLPNIEQSHFHMILNHLRGVNITENRKCFLHITCPTKIVYSESRPTLTPNPLFSVPLHFNFLNPIIKSNFIATQ